MPPEEEGRARWPSSGKLVRIHDASGFWPLAERLHVAHGVERPEESEAYEADAFVPRGRWERVPETVLAALAAPATGWELKRTVGIVRVPEEAYAGLARVGVARARDAAAYKRALGDSGLEAALEEASIALGEYLLSAGGLALLGTFACAPGLRTVTPNNDGVGRRVGLHLDAWDELHPNGYVTNRICLNLGREERAFLYVPLATESIGLKGSGVARFFEANPSCPVLRLRLAPGEAYIAPTEHVLPRRNDGSSRARWT